MQTDPGNTTEPLRVALASCSNLPDWEVDDRPLHEACAELGLDARVLAWDDPSVDWAAFDGVLIRTTWDYTARPAEGVHATTPIFNDPTVVRWNTRKTYLRELAERGVPVVPTVWLESGDAFDLPAALEGLGAERGFLKPVIGASSESTMRFTAPAELSAAEEFLTEALATRDMMIQPYLDTVESEGERSVLFIDGEVTHCVSKHPVKGDYRTQDDYGASDRPFTPDESELAFARHAVEATGFEDLLYARVDYLRDASGSPRLIELELVEPSLFFRHGPGAAMRLARALRDRAAARK